MSRMHIKNEQKKQNIKIDNVLPTWADFKLTLSTLLRSSCIGTFIGCVPGTGGDISSWISYDQAKRWAKDKSQFGKGDPRAELPLQNQETTRLSAELLFRY